MTNGSVEVIQPVFGDHNNSKGGGGVIDEVVRNDAFDAFSASLKRTSSANVKLASGYPANGFVSNIFLTSFKSLSLIRNCFYDLSSINFPSFSSLRISLKMDPAFRSRFGSDSINVMRRVVAQAQEFFFLPSLATRLTKLVLGLFIVQYYGTKKKC